MTENIEEMENMTVDTEAKVQEKQPDEAVKTYTQAEVDNIVKGRLARERDKTKTLKAENAELTEAVKDYKILSKIFEEKGNFKGTPKEQITQAAEYYGVSEDDVKKMITDAELDDKSDKQTMAYFNAKRFVEQSEPDEIQEEYDRINAIPEDKRNIREKELFKQLKPRVAKDITEKVNADRKWFEENVGGDFNKFLRSEEFNDFMDGTNLSVRKGMEKFIKLKGKDAVKEAFAKDEVKKEQPASTGSVKDSGASNLKEYYSPEDVDNLSEKDFDDPVIFERVRQSMTKWK